MSVASLLDRLQGVRATGSHRWLARCSAHEDRSPSLSIRELDDGRVLIHCFAGCGALDVLSAAGLDWSALYPAGLSASAPSHSRVSAREVLEIVSHEITVSVLILSDALEGRSIIQSQWSRLATAAARIGKARDYACR